MISPGACVSSARMVLVVVNRCSKLSKINNSPLAACVVATTSLQPDDQMILHSGEAAPVDGLITKASYATFKPRSSHVQATLVC